MNHTVSISGGLSSAVAADRVIQRFGREVTLWFADTQWEDEDLYRFLADLESHWGMPIQRASDGRTPLQVAEWKQIIPNNHIAPCSDVLKVQQRAKYLATVERPVTVYIGYDWSEMHRVKKMQGYDHGDGVTIDFPLLWPPAETRPYDEIIRSWGIHVPRLYALGFSHNNCGGRCVRQGIRDWLRLLRAFPERFAGVEEWEQAQRAKGGARANWAICRDRTGGVSRPVTLREIRDNAEQLEAVQPSLPENGEHCLCIA